MFPYFKLSFFWGIVKIRAIPIKCLDLDDTSAQLKLEGWRYNVLFFIPFLKRRPHFIINLGEEAPFY